MEELQDAIEDAQYMNAMHDDSPKPTKEWKRPSPEEYQKYMNRLQSADPKALTPEGICAGCLGLYMFMKFVKDQGERVASEFIVDVGSYRSKISTNLAGTVNKICSDYIAERSVGNDDPLDKRPTNVVRSLSYLKRKVVVEQTKVLDPGTANQHTTGASLSSKATESSAIEISPLDSGGSISSPQQASSKSMGSTKFISWSDFYRPEEAVNAIKVLGEPIDVVKRAIASNEITVKMFDDLDRIIFAYLCATYFDGFKASPEWTNYHGLMWLGEQEVTEDDFSLFRVLGRGGFGLVNGCKRCYSGKLFAMKTMNKKRVKMKKSEALCQNERNILAAVDSPFVVCLKYAFATSTDLYLILDLMIGGDLGFHLARKGRFSMAETKYYSARILLGIGALHDLSIVYRDLKPENVLMDEYGYTRLSDFGLACRVGRSGLSGTCGTRGYWAPEMLRRDEAGKRERYFLSVDWFSYGCVVYEFMYGISPFRTDRARQWGNFPKVEKADKDKAIDLAIQEMEPDFDESFDSVSKDFLSKLLDKNGRTRLGANGYREIMAHEFFADIDWDNLSRSTPPMKPAKDINMATQSEIGSFSDEKASKKIVLTEEDHKVYEKWHFISSRAYEEEVVEFLLFEERMGPIKPENYGSFCCCVIS